MRADQILYPTEAGLYCALGDFFIDPVRPVPRALITHGHGDHARTGHGAVMATAQTLDIMAIRYGEDFTASRQIAYGPVRVGDTTVSFHPAGHVLGSAQIAIHAKNGPRFTVSGDYCRTPNPVCLPWQPVPCDVFVTEATFGLPVFRHPDPLAETQKLLASMAEFPDRAHLIGAYALGKAQRVIALLRQAGYDTPIHLHGAAQRLTDYHVAQGVPLGDLRPATQPKEIEGQVVIAPPSAFASAWVQRFRDPVIGFASGWMAVRARARQRGTELPLVISDHVDWPQLTATLRRYDPNHLLLRITATEAGRGLVDFARIEEMLDRSPKLDHRMLDRVSPLAAPLMLEMGRVRIDGQARMRLAEEEAAAMMAEAGLNLGGTADEIASAAGIGDGVNRPATGPRTRKPTRTGDAPPRFAPRPLKLPRAR